MSRSFTALFALLATSLFACAAPDGTESTSTATPAFSNAETNGAKLADQNGTECVDTFACEDGHLVLHRAGAACDSNVDANKLAAMYQDRTVVTASTAHDWRVDALATEAAAGVTAGINDVINPCR